MSKRVLLIAGGGTLGTYTAKELLSMGHKVDIICPEEKTSNDENLRFFRSMATYEYLSELLEKEHYDGIVNFVHYPDIEEYKPVHKLLTDNTEHLIFLSSYRVYADLEHPITEDAPRLLDVSTDEKFLAEETYALSKAKAEDFIRASGTKNWTIVRPVISFSDRRFDIVTVNERVVLERVKEGRELILPENVRNLTAALDWAGNSGKLIASLLFKDAALGEAFTVSSAQNLTWGEVADIYTELIGLKVRWIDPDEWLKHEEYVMNNRFAAIYDRFFDRSIDNSKILSVTGLTNDDFLSIKDGIGIELAKINWEK
ncbi:MAG: hypothetical protein IKK94_01390 [Clostridia bacterium]|nr:hypothetical protein [Clostridia bacterium]